MEIQARGFTAQLSKAESDINQAAKNLEQTFQAANAQAKEQGSKEIPDPIKLVKRITALEIAIGNLRKDCEQIAENRSKVVQKSLSVQRDTVARVKELLARTEDQDPYSSHEDLVDESWNSFTGCLEKQLRLIQSTDIAK